MKKKILLLIIPIILTGCSAKYDINFDENKIHDNIEIYEDSKKINTATEEQENQINDLLLDWENGYDFYKRELYTTDKITGYRYTFDFNYDEYDAMSQLRRCYEEFEFNYETNKIRLITSDEFLCGTYYPDTKEIEINITSKYEITSANADKHENNTYTWIVNKNNYKDHSINLIIDKTKEYKEPKEKILSTKQILVLILFVVLVIILIIRKRRNK